MTITPLRAAGLLAALVFAVLTIRSYRRGKIGNGGMLLNLHTGDGSIKVGRLAGSI